MKGALCMARMTAAARACADLEALIEQGNQQAIIDMRLGELEHLIMEALEQGS